MRQTSGVRRLARGLFNHLAVLYQLALHQQHGSECTAHGLGTTDYLFFMVVLTSGRLAHTTLDLPVARIDASGVSTGPQALGRKHAIDRLRGRSSRGWLVPVLLGHPLYRRPKRLWQARP